MNMAPFWPAFAILSIVCFPTRLDDDDLIPSPRKIQFTITSGIHRHQRAHTRPQHRHVDPSKRCNTTDLCTAIISTAEIKFCGTCEIARSAPSQRHSAVVCNTCCTRSKVFCRLALDRQAPVGRGTHASRQGRIPTGRCHRKMHGRVSRHLRF